MSRTEFVLATAIILFVAFCMGWFANWLLNRFTRVAADDVDLDLETSPTATAETTRPFNVSNSDNKLVSRCANDTFAMEAGRLSHIQKGFIKGRSMLDHVFTVEAYLLCMVLSQSSSVSCSV